MSSLFLVGLVAAGVYLGWWQWNRRHAQERRPAEVGASNQGAPLEHSQRRVILHRGMRYASHSEKALGIALEDRGVPFLPNCRVRVRSGQAFEPDFLVLLEDGRWAVIEVDGAGYHDDADAERHREAQLYDAGATIVYRVPAEQARESPYRVIDQFYAELGVRA